MTGRLGFTSLQNDKSLTTPATGTPRHLAHHHKRMLIGAEVGIVEHAVSIKYTYHGHVAKIKSLADHLRTNEHIGATAPKLVDDALVSIACARGVEVHTSHTRFGEVVAHKVL